MAKSIDLVTVGVNEELGRVRSNRFLIELVCEAHAALDDSDREATAREIAKDAAKELYPVAGHIGYTEATGKEDYIGSCGCGAWLVTP